MQSAELRKLAADLRTAASKDAEQRTVKAAQVLEAAVGLHLLKEKVRHHA